MKKHETAKTRIEALDPNLANRPVDADGLVWYAGGEAPLQLNGFHWFDRDRRFRRLPVRPDFPISAEVELLANHTAGGQLRFYADCRRLALRADLGALELIPHMAATGSSGFDLYVGEPGCERFLTSARPDIAAASPLLAADWLHLPPDTPRRMRLFTIHFPLYNAVQSVAVGVDGGTQVLPPPPYADARPIVAYGTSITQGGCASRPGSAYSNILARRLRRPFLNLGFSGNGKGEPDMARLIAQIADPALFIVDYEANVGDGIAATLPEFLRIYRAAHPETPVLVVSGIRFGDEAFDQAPDGADVRPAALRSRRDAAARAVADRVAAGDRHIRFLDGGTLLDARRYDDATVDGVHPTDWGFQMMADAFEPVLRAML